MEVQSASPVGRFFKEALEKRAKKNPRYSLRSFARDLSISPQHLSHLIQGKRGLSPTIAGPIAKRLGLSSDEKRFFVCLVEAYHSRSATVREAATKRLERLTRSYRNLPTTEFKSVSEWYPLAILTMSQLEDLRDDAAGIASRLKVSAKVVQDALVSMKELGMIEIDANGFIRSLGNYFIQSSEQPSEAIREYHKRFLQLTISAIEHQSVQERDYSQIYFGIDETRIQEAKEFIADFRREFSTRFFLRTPAEVANAKKLLSTLNTQIFRISPLEAKESAV